jgi:hypothetical protein
MADCLDGRSRQQTFEAAGLIRERDAADALPLSAINLNRRRSESALTPSAGIPTGQ